MNVDTLIDYLSDVRYPNVRFVVRLDGEVSAHLQVLHASGMTGRKWRLSFHMTKSEVVQTALMAVLAWEEHEVREAFTYKGRAIFSPHYDVDALHTLSADVDNYDVRAMA